MQTEHANGNQIAHESQAKKTLGILQAGRAPEQLLGSVPDYNELFIDLLGQDSFHYRTWAVLDNEFPASLELSLIHI